MYEITKELILSNEALNKALKENIKALEEAVTANNELKELLQTLTTSALTGHAFYNHIKSHLSDGEDVTCKICGKTANKIYEETILKGDDNEF